MLSAYQDASGRLTGIGYRPYHPSALCSYGNPRVKSQSLMVKVCHCYYRDHMTMAEIGLALDISRHRVGRLLKEAVDSGVVRIEIRSPFNASTELERALETAFALRSSVVVEPDPGLDPEAVKRQTCRAGAEFLRDLLDERSTIGIGWGTTTFELVMQLDPLELPGARVVQITGGTQSPTGRFDCHEVTRQLALKLHARPLLLHAPGIVDKPTTRDMLLRESAIKASFRHFKHIDVAIVGIGSLLPSVRSMLVESGYVSPTELASLKRAGAVGDVFSYFFDESGAVVRTDLYDRLITIGLSEIRRIPTSIAIATSPAKAKAVAAAVRGGFVNTLIVDADLARAMLALNAAEAAT